MQKKNFIKIIFGYRNLLKENKLDFISQYQEEISKIKLINNSFINNYFFPKTTYDKDTVFINFFLSKIGILNLRYYLIKFFFCYKSKLIVPLPEKWLNYLSNKNLNINIFFSKFFFKFIVIKYFFYGIYINIRIILLLFKNLFSKDFKNFVFFNNINSSNLPSFIENSNTALKENYSLYDFYKLNMGKDETKLFLFSSENQKLKKINFKKIKNDTFSYNRYPIQISLPLKYFFIFLKDTFAKIFLSFLSLITGKFWNVFLLAEQPLMSLSRMKLQDNLPKEVIFHLSDLYYRPLWTYEMENRGTNIYMLWYSTNNQANYKKNIEEKFFYDWSNIIWQNHIVWNENHKIWLMKYLNNKNQNIIFYDYIWFNDLSINLNLDNNIKYISIFPVTPFRRAYFSLINEDEYQTLTCKNQIQFIKDILELTAEKKYKILLKNKRNLDRNHDKSYSNFLNTIDDRYVKIINENISPIKLIKRSMATINFPFTSTAHLSHNFNLPTVYYDVTRRLKNFSLNQDIKIINDKSKLLEWINRLK